MYGYGLEGYGYRYPKRKRRLTVETYYPENVYPDVIRAATFNRALARKNDWIQHLKTSGFYDEVRKLLQKARATYKPKDPAKRAAVLSRELTKLQAQLNLLEKEKTAKTLEDEYKKRYGEKFKDLSYEDVLKDKIDRLRSEIARIQQSLPTGQLQQALP
jgi:vacuolar-type H+-ATPase subunit I/STV1